MMKSRSILCFILLISGFAQAQSNKNIRALNVDVTKVKGQKNLMFQDCIGAGRASEGLRADWQQQLTLMQKEIGFKYIRFHGLLSDEMHVYTENNGVPVYNWQYVDKLYDFLLSIHVRPFVEFGFMPPDLSSNDKTVFWWKGNISPPKSYEKWAALITAMVKHFEERYGKAEVEKWRFEVWNEPNLKQFFSGDMNEYFKLYLVTAKAVKSVSKTYQVGGPATSGSTWIKEALQYFATIPDLVDFISTHAYGTKSVFDEFGKKRTQMREADGIPIAISKLKQDVDNSPLRGRKIYITEWNSSPNPHDPLHDTYQNATYALNSLKKTESLVDAMSYWTFTDIFEEAGPPVTNFHGGFGLLNLQAIKKPTYNAYKFLNELGSTELINPDSSSYACKDKQGNIQLLFWNYKLLSPDSSYNQQFYSHIIPAKPAGQIKINISNLKKGKYELLIYQTGYQINDPYTAYMEMGSPGNISLAQEKILREKGICKPVKKIVEVKGSSYQTEFSWKENDTYFLKLNRL